MIALTYRVVTSRSAFFFACSTTVSAFMIGTLFRSMSVTTLLTASVSLLLSSYLILSVSYFCGFFYASLISFPTRAAETL